MHAEEGNTGEVNASLAMQAEKSAGRGKCRQRKMQVGGNAGRGNAKGGKCRQKKMQAE